ncbi:IucA/IucC family protein [Paenibacillus sp. GCM10027627]|uniref:IucA/IucC family protein n=1 Tax=unclassified Paenibacillus TaxID=185978 RepID=UPI00363ED374
MIAVQGTIDAGIVARRTVFRKTIEALVFEGVLKPVPASQFNEHVERSGCTEAGSGIWTLEGRSVSGEKVFYECKAEIRFSFAMFRLSGDEPVIRRSSAYREEASSLALFIEETIAAMNTGHPASVKATFIQELEETVKKDAQSVVAVRERREPLFGRSLAELESLSPDGHPYHPCYKSRIGFNLQDNKVYGPEFQPQLRAFWIAALYADTNWGARDADNWDGFLERQLDEADLARFRAILEEQGLDLALYAMMPVHPWQWDNKISTERLDDLKTKRLVPLGFGSDAFIPQQSIRTLTGSRQNRNDLKLSLGIVNTSSIRHLTDHSVTTASAVSGWLQKVVDQDRYLQEAGLVILHEYAGISYTPAQGALGSMWRENTGKYLKAGEEAVPFYMLACKEADGSPFMAPWERAYGFDRWFRRFIQVCIIPVVHLLAAQGLVLESHSQNMILIHRNGWPERVALRDFHEGVEYVGSFLTSPELLPEFGDLHPAYKDARPNDFFEMASLKDLSEMLMDALWFMNMGYLIMDAADRSECSEQELWQIVAEELIAYEQRADEGLKERIRQLQWFQPECVIEPLAQKRLFGGVAVQPRSVPNPLYEVLRRNSIETRRDLDVCSGS